MAVTSVLSRVYAGFSFSIIFGKYTMLSMCGSKRGQGYRPLPEKNIGFLSNSGQGPLKNYKAAKPVLSHHRPARET